MPPPQLERKERQQLLAMEKIKKSRKPLPKKVTNKMVTKSKKTEQLKMAATENKQKQDVMKISLKKNKNPKKRLGNW